MGRAKFEFKWTVPKNSFGDIADGIDPTEITDNVVDAALDAAQTAAPYRTGHLYRELGTERVDANTARLESNADYSAHVEFGTEDTRAQPFMGPAALAGEQQMAEEVDRIKRMAEGA